MSGTGPAAVLIGVPGSGKSTVGALLADRLGLAFRDTDSDIESACGTTTADILLHQGEARFRVIERAAVRRALADHGGVLALGGGSVLDDRTQRLLSGQRVVHLWVGLDTAVRRVGAARTRPLLADDPVGELGTLFRVRLPIYRRLARYSVRADARPAAETVAEIAELLAADGVNAGNTANVPGTAVPRRVYAGRAAGREIDRVTAF